MRGGASVAKDNRLSDDTRLNEPALHLADGVALWAEIRTRDIAPGSPALFLDRDGVVVEEVHFLRRAEDVRLMPGIAEAIREANAAGVPVIIVTNQSGVARGHFGWHEFVTVESEIAARLAAEGARIDALFGCGYHKEGNSPFDLDHDWRKPGPGMLREAARLLGVDLKRSVMIGDRISDLQAGRSAGLKAGLLVRTGYGAENVEALEERRAEWEGSGFSVQVVEEPAKAVQLALETMAG
jgi:D-glycero-D-manno-heptose 1,7-bisphosphate phosphatase